MGTLASAIASLENVNPVYNNPGAISGTGDTGSSFGAGIGIYSTLSAGQSALENQLSRIYSGASSLYPGGSSMTLDEFGEVYAPNQNYGSSLASILGVPSSTPLSAIPSGISGVGGSQQITGGSSLPTGTASSWNPFTGSGALGTIASNFSRLTSGSVVQDAVVVVVGIILIAAGVFAFKESQTVLQVATKGVRRIGEAASAA